ncbi:hypothetical protein AWH56_013330 [Anaerobacillus isosaccharinicus]|uniref:Uncharacterized protein n=1 Tax=Anaerobacillus isosaccharinicus TaxID=1532552 RepID=A0A1S2LBU1_9BACI|nr:hypothetical protein [Anaerobacillus isosaccharinicus]MBA5588121.1 hypothetical protein [Anaerobacillus isosaccharinicus]QOY38422.1 hypothetical protein AWH56_013330 [Anaerobacillus isosaccharinicus]
MNVLITAILPLFILLIVAAIATGLIKLTAQNAKFLNGKAIMYIFAGYGAIVFSSVLFTYTIPSETSEIGEISTKQVQEITDHFYEAINEGNLAEVEGVKVTDNWNFPFNENILNIKTVLNDSYSHSWVVVDKDTNLVDEVRITRYTTPHIVNGVEYTERINSPTLNLQSNTLTIKPPGRTEIRLSKFHKEFPITQFTGEKMFPSHESTWSANVLYLQVPAHVKITADENVSLQYRGQ